jgi:hypothetical protein
MFESAEMQHAEKRAQLGEFSALDRFLSWHENGSGKSSGQPFVEATQKKQIGVRL